ncbi:MAG TPA: hypothetical protein VIH86_05930 [Puia sp.]
MSTSSSIHAGEKIFLAKAQKKYRVEIYSKDDVEDKMFIEVIKRRLSPRGEG